MINEYHQKAQELSSDAFLSTLRSETDRAKSLFKEAASLEEWALEEINNDQIRTRGIIAVSAASMYYKAGDHEGAERVAEAYINQPNIYGLANQQLYSLLQAIQNQENI